MPHLINKNVINFVAFQLIWLAAVLGAAKQIVWPCIVFTALFAAWQLSPKQRHPNDSRLLLIALPIGLVADSFWQISGLVQYASAGPLSPLAPIWIMMLWVAFALTFNHSLAWLKSKLWLAALFGLFGSPLSYWAGSRLGAMSYLHNPWWVSIAFGISWAGIVCLLCHQGNRPKLKTTP